MLMNHTRGLQLWEETQALIVLHLDVPEKVCLESIQKRRAEVGREPKFKTNTHKNFNTHIVRCRNYCSKLRLAGCSVIKVSREDALERLYEQIAGE